MKHENQCGTKGAYATLEAAEAAAYRPRRLLAVHGFMGAYKCRFCKQFHYGHPAGFK